MNVSQRFYFESHLKILYKLFRCLGLIPFKYNRSTKKFEYSRILSIVSRIIYNCVGCAYVVWILVEIVSNVRAYIDETQLSPIVAQDDLLQELCRLKDYLSLILFVSNYLKVRRILLPTINEIADIAERIQIRTNAGLYVDGSLTKVLFMKLFILFHFVWKLVVVYLPITLILYNFLWIFAYAIPILTFGSHVYSQLVLISAYTKMNELLSQGKNPRQIENQNMRKLVKEFLQISHRIHRVKQKLNNIYQPVFIATVIGAAYDITQMYKALQTIVYFKYMKNIHNPLIFISRMKFPECIAHSFDMYLIGLLSDSLLKAEDEFQDLAMNVMGNRKSMRRDTELMLFKSHVFGLETSVHGGIRVNQQYAFDFFFSIVLIIALTCLQFYAAEVIYSPNKVASSSNDSIFID